MRGKVSHAAKASAVRHAFDTATEMAAHLKADDPLHPWVFPSPWTDWMDFTRKVCVPLVEDPDPEAEQRLMVEFRKANPHYIAVALVMALNRIERPV